MYSNTRRRKMRIRQKTAAIITGITLIASSLSVGVSAKYSHEIPDALMLEPVNYLESGGTFAAARNKWTVYDATVTGPTANITNSTLGKVTNTYVKSVATSSVKNNTSLYVGAFQNSQGITMYTQNSDGSYKAACGAAKFELDNNDISDGQDYVAVIGNHKVDYYDFRSAISWEGSGSIGTNKTADLDVSRFTKDAYVVVGIQAQQNAQLDSTYISLASFKVQNQNGQSMDATIRAVTGVPISRYYSESDKGTYREIAIPLTDFDTSNEWVVSKLALNAVNRPDGFPEDYKIPVNYKGFLGMGMMKTRTDETPADNYGVFVTKFQIACFNEATEGLTINGNSLSWVKPRNNSVSHYSITAVNGNETNNYYIPVSELSERAGMYTWNIPDGVDSRSLFKVSAVAGEFVGNEDVGYDPIYSECATVQKGGVHTAVTESVEMLPGNQKLLDVTMPDGSVFKGAEYTSLYKGGKSDISAAANGGYAVFVTDSAADVSQMRLALGSKTGTGYGAALVNAADYADSTYTNGEKTYIRVPIADFAADTAENIGFDSNGNAVSDSKLSLSEFSFAGVTGGSAESVMIVNYDISPVITLEDATDKEVIFAIDGANTIVNTYTLCRDGETVATADGGSNTVSDSPSCGFESDREYTYTLQAEAECGAVFDSNEIKVVVPKLDMPRDFAVNTVYNTTANPTIRLTWQAPKFGADIISGFEIYRNGSLIATADKDALSYDDTSLEYGKDYEYTMRSVGIEDGENVYSLSTAAYSATAVCIASPDGVNISTENAVVHISWNTVENATGYRVYADGVLVGETSYTNINITPEKYNTYFDITLTAVNAGGAESLGVTTEKVYVTDPYLDSDRIVIYGDSFTSVTAANGGAVLNERDSEKHVEGTSSARLDFSRSKAPYGTVDIAYAFDASGMRAADRKIAMQLSAEDYNILKNVRIALSCESKVANVSGTIYSSLCIGDYAQNTDKWQYVSIPLNDFPTVGTGKGDYKTISGEMDFGKITGIRIYCEVTDTDSAVINIDDMVICGAKMWKTSDIIRDTDGNVIDSRAAGAVQGIRILFDMPMNGASLNPSTVTLAETDGAAVTTYGEYVTAENVYIMHLAEPLKANTAYTITINGSSAVSSATGSAKLEFVTGNFEPYEIINKPTEIAYSLSFSQNGSKITVSAAPSVGTSIIAGGINMNIAYDSNILSVEKVSAQNANVTESNGVITIDISSSDGIDINKFVPTVTFTLKKEGSAKFSVYGKITSASSASDIMTLSASAEKTFTFPDSSGSGSSGGGSSAGSGAASASRPSGGTIPDVKPDTRVSFADMSGFDWAAESVKKLAEAGIVNGYDDNTFRPSALITREEFAKMIVLLCNLQNESADSAFNDVEPGAWYAPYVNIAAKYSLVNGMGGGSFGTGRYITRQEMCVMAERAANLIKASGDYIYDEMSFDDADTIAPYAADSVRRLFRMGLINGVDGNRFDPNESVNRAMAAKILYAVYALNN